MSSHTRNLSPDDFILLDNLDNLIQGRPRLTSLYNSWNDVYEYILKSFKDGTLTTKRNEQWNGIHSLRYGADSVIGTVGEFLTAFHLLTFPQYATTINDVELVGDKDLQVAGVDLTTHPQKQNVSVKLNNARVETNETTLRLGNDYFPDGRGKIPLHFISFVDIKNPKQMTVRLYDFDGVKRELTEPIRRKEGIVKYGSEPGRRYFYININKLDPHLRSTCTYYS